MSFTPTKIISFLSLIICLSVMVNVTPLHLVRAEGVDVSTNQQFDIKAIKNDLREFNLNWLATTLAKQVLHQITISTINWINKGFEGSPSFLTNPEGFFLDVGDQVTGEFLDDKGALSRLCSPFSIDIRLALALDQTVSPSKRYECTLGTIVNNTRGTIEGFTGGDFSQGGWPAFISLSVEPQNNVYGSYLQAHSELLELIGQKEGKVNQDLDRGNGFLSWEKCDDVPESEVYNQQSFYEEENYYGQGPDFNRFQKDAYADGAKGATLKTGNGTSLRAVKDGGGGLTYKSCSTQTPGSVIAGSLQKAIDSPIVEGELADDINAVMNALVSQMITQMLSGGLAALSGGGSGGRPAYTQQVIAEIDAENAQTLTDNNTQLSTTFDPAIKLMTEYKAVYDQAVATISSDRAHYQSARSCFVQRAADPQYSQDIWQNIAQQRISEIDGILAGRIDPLLATLTAKQTDANTKITNLNKLKAESYSNTQQGSQFGGVRSQIPLYDSAIQGSVEAQSVTTVGMSNAQKELTEVQAQSQKFVNNVSLYDQACSSFPSITFIPGLDSIFNQ